MDDLFHRAGRRRRVVDALGSLALLAGLTWASLFTVTGQNLDNLAMDALWGRAALLPQHLGVATSLVSIPALAVISVGVALVALLRRRPALALRAVAVVAGANLTTQVLKSLLVRPDLGVSISLDNSYPSGHTTFAAAISVALILVAPKGMRTAAAFGGWLLTSVMAVVVISQGWHRLSDVLAAILVVGIWAFLAAPIENQDRRAPRLVSRAAWVAWGLALVGGVALAVGFLRLGVVLAEPLSQSEIFDLIEAGQPGGAWLAVAAMVLPSGVAGLLMNAIDRFSGSIEE